MTASITYFIREILRTQAKPPRRVEYGEVLGAVFRETSTRTIFLFGLGGALLFLITTQNARPFDRIGILALFGIPCLLVAALPFYSAGRIFNAIKIGEVLYAEVESLEYSQDSQNTLDALENGFARGTWRLPEGQLINFQIDEPWARDIKVGSHVEILVISPKFSGIFPLGLHE